MEANVIVFKYAVKVKYFIGTFKVIWAVEQIICFSWAARQMHI